MSRSPIGVEEYDSHMDENDANIDDIIDNLNEIDWNQDTWGAINENNTFNVDEEDDIVGDIVLDVSANTSVNPPLIMAGNTKKHHKSKKFKKTKQQKNNKKSKRRKKQKTKNTKNIKTKKK